MASSSELKSLISNTKTLKQLANGQGLPMAINFKSNADLKFSISSCNIIGSKLSGNKLTLAIYDVSKIIYCNPIYRWGNCLVCVLKELTEVDSWEAVII